MVTIGQRNRLTVIREAPPGLYLNGGPKGDILLPGRYIPKGTQPGAELDVFVYLDSEDRLVATTETPLGMVGDFACLRVISVNPRIGAFLDWGLAKDLLLPFREQETPVRATQRVVVHICVDARTNRIVATTRLGRHLSRETPAYKPGAKVALLITEKTGLGYKAIVDNAHAGLLYHDRVSAPLEIGRRIEGYVRAVRPGGKIDLSLEPAGYQRVRTLKDQVLEALQRNSGRLEFDDDSPPEAIRINFQASKRAFKQALGALYKARRIRFTRPGIELVPGEDPGKTSDKLVAGRGGAR